MLYLVSQFLLKLFFRLLFRWKVYGRANLAIRGGAILAANHTSFLDPFLVGTPAPRKIYFFARQDLFHPKIRGWFLKQLHALPVDRGKPSLGSFKNILNLLSSGEVVVVFPEGTRGSGQVLGEPRTGLGMLVAKSGVPVIPVYISGAARALPKGAWIPRLQQIKIIYGPPLRFSRAANDGGGKAAFQKIGTRVMAEIARLKEELGSRQ